MPLTRDQLVKAYVEYGGKIITVAAKHEFAAWLERNQPDIAVEVLAKLRRARDERRRSGG